MTINFLKLLYFNIIYTMYLFFVHKSHVVKLIDYMDLNRWSSKTKLFDLLTQG
jgi:hypothetical protein